MSKVSDIARSLTLPQREMVLASDRDDIDGYEGCGVDLFTGADYAVAKALERKGVGHREGPGGFRYAGMYWNNNLGLLVRDYLRMHPEQAREVRSS